MLIKGLDLLFLEVNSLEESINFYQALGFALESNSINSDPPMATLRAGRLQLKLVQNLETMLRRGRGAHFFLSIDNVDEFYEMTRLYRPEIQSPVDEGWGGRFVTLEDPDKYRFFFVQWDAAEAS